jgi:hypothetical protein
VADNSSAAIGGGAPVDPVILRQVDLADECVLKRRGLERLRVRACARAVSACLGTVGRYPCGLLMPVLHRDAYGGCARCVVLPGSTAARAGLPVCMFVCLFACLQSCSPLAPFPGIQFPAEVLTRYCTVQLSTHEHLRAIFGYSVSAEVERLQRALQLQHVPTGGNAAIRFGPLVSFRWFVCLFVSQRRAAKRSAA